MLMKILLTISLIIAFTYIYKKYKTDNEEFLIAKLIGYYLLGSFRLNFNNIALPAGFIVYLAFFKPQVNKPVKKAITLLGLFMFFCGLVLPFVQKSYFERQRVVTASSNNIYKIDFKKDHDSIKQKLGVNENTKIKNFDASFEESGLIKELRYTFLTSNNEGIVLYNVNFSPDKNRFTIKPSKVGGWLQYDGFVDGERFFYALNSLDFEEVKPKEIYPFYTIKCEGGYTNWGIKDWENFLITDDGIKKLRTEDLPVSGYGVWIFGNKKTSENSYTSDSNKAFIITY